MAQALSHTGKHVGNQSMQHLLVNKPRTWEWRGEKDIDMICINLGVALGMVINCQQAHGISLGR